MLSSHRTCTIGGLGIVPGHGTRETDQVTDPEAKLTLFEHGARRYNRGCRCEECKAGHAERAAQQRERRRQRALDPEDPRHGTLSFYSNYGCRCDRCRSAWAAYFRDRPQAVD